MIAGKSILDHLIVRKQQILAVEAFAAAAAPWISPEIFSHRESIWFVDNAAAVSTLIRGSAKPVLVGAPRANPDVGKQIQQQLHNDDPSISGQTCTVLPSQEPALPDQALQPLPVAHTAASGPVQGVPPVDPVRYR